MKLVTRRVGTVAAEGVGEVELEWRSDPSQCFEVCHVQVTEPGGGSTYTSQILGTLDPSRVSEVELSPATASPTIHESVTNVPYMKVIIDVSVYGAGTFEVWVSE